MDPTVEAILRMPFPGYQWPLDKARSLARSQEPEKLRQAVDLLRGLTQRYPHSLAVGQEYILALIESDQEPAAETELARLEDIFQGLDMELLCRWGRLFKDKGDRHSGSEWVRKSGPINLELAIAHYHKSITMYARAFSLSEHYYPGINEATLTLILAAVKADRSEQSQSPPPRVAELAEQIESGRSLNQPGSDEDEKIWKPATRGEASLLKQDWGAAAGYYDQVLGSLRVTQHARDAMRWQVHRIAESFAKLGKTPAAPFDRSERIVAFFRADRPANPTSPPAAA